MKPLLFSQFTKHESTFCWARLSIDNSTINLQQTLANTLNMKLYHPCIVQVGSRIPSWFTFMQKWLASWYNWN